MSPLEEADLILSWFQDKSKATIASIGEGIIIDRFKKDKLDTLKIKLILEKLVEDGVLKEFKQPNAASQYQITHKGYYFKGYVIKEKKEAASALFQTSILILGCVGTLAAGLYALKEMIQSEIYRLVLFSIFLSTIGTGLLLLLYLRYFQNIWRKQSTHDKSLQT